MHRVQPDTTTIIRFINPEPLTKKGIQEHNRQIHLIYTDKHGNELQFVPIAHKVGGCAFGTIFARVISQTVSKKQWIGKIGDTRDLIDSYNYNFEDLNIDVIFEKLASDLYEEFGRGFFKVPKTRLSCQPLVNQFGPTKHRPHLPPPNIDSLFVFIQHNSDKRSLRIMSKYVDGYHSFKDTSTVDLDGTPISCLEFIKKHHRPPETLFNPSGDIVPLYGLMELIAVGRILADTDILGGLCDNAGFTWIIDNGNITGADAVKIDPGKALTFSHVRGSNPIEFNWVLNTKYSPHLSAKLDDLKDIQTAQNYKCVTLHWSTLTSTQKEIFLGILFNSSRYLQAPNILHYLFYRDGKFQHLPLSIAQQFQKELQGWLELQFEIYADDLQAFHQKYPQQALRAHYIDSCGEISLPMTDETFPIRDLFTELVIVDGTDKKEDGRKALSAYLPETDSFKETTDRLELFSNTITLEKLFDGKKKIMLIGRAGIGKSTLCQKIAHDWASGRLWKDRFDAVYWLPLRNLNDLKVGDDLKEFLLGVALPHLFSNVATLKALCEGIHSKKVLLILDGYDEATPDLAQAVEKLMAETPFHILLTSRPGNMDAIKADQIVENIGFSDKHIRTYIDKFCKRHAEDFTKEDKSHALFTAIKNHPNLYPIAHVPLQLQMILALYKKTEEIQSASSLTKLYQMMTEELYSWHFRGQKLGERDVMLSTLGEIALIGLNHGKLLIPEKKVQALISDLLLQAGILKKIEGIKNSYQFIHLTFQEFLVARYVSRKSLEKQKLFILEHRHKPSYQLVLAFLAGLLVTYHKTVQEFFATLYRESSYMRLETAYLLELTLRCLNECEGFEETIPGLDALVARDAKTWDTHLRDGYTPILSAAFQQQTYAFKWLGNHYPQLLKRAGSPFKGYKGYYVLPGSYHSALHLFARNGNVDAIKFCLQHEPQLIKYTSDGWTPLHEAASGGHVEAMKLLLEHDKTLIYKYISGRTPLHEAVAGGHVEAMKLLLEQDRTLIYKHANDESWSGWTLLHEAASRGHVEAMKLLLEQDKALISKCTTDRECNSGRTPLHAAASGGHVEAMKLLLEQDKTLISKYADGKYDSGLTPLHEAASGGHVEAMKLLLEQDHALISAYRNDGWTPFHAAARYGRVKAMEFLLEQDHALISAYGNDGWTSLHQAASGGHVEAMKLLLEQDQALISVYRNDGWTSLHQAASGGHVEAMKLLLEQDHALISAYRNDGWTPFHAAARYGHVKAMKFLLEQNAAFISTYTNKGWTPFHAAIQGRSKKAGEFILQRAPELLNQPTEQGNTPLMLLDRGYEVVGQGPPDELADWLVSIGGEKKKKETCAVM